MIINFFTADIRVRIPDKERLRLFITSIFNKEGKRAEVLNYIFSSDEYLLDINQRFLGHDYFTDIITFNISPPQKNSPIEGEVYISIDRIKENAKDLKQAYSRELHRVIFHGALHLCGYKDKTPSAQSKMRAKEDYYLNLYFK